MQMKLCPFCNGNVADSGTKRKTRSDKIFCSKRCATRAWGRMHPNYDKERYAKKSDEQKARRAARGRLYYQNHRKEIIKRNSAYKTAKREKIKAARMSSPFIIRKAEGPTRKKECLMCKSKDRLGLHHLRPRSKGGNDEKRNLIILCSKCHDWVEENNPTWDIIAGANTFIKYQNDT